MSRRTTLFLATAMAAALTIGGTAMAQQAQPAAGPKAGNAAEKPATPVADREAAKDPFLWLEEVEGAKAIEWAKAQNQTAFARLKADPRFEEIRAEAERILTARDRIPYGTIDGNKVSNFWQDQTNVRGIWRETTMDSYRTADPAWVTVLDVDALAKAENRNWVYRGAQCLPPENRLCLVTLSDGGKDAATIREFDAVEKRFVEGGFVLPEAKQSASWIDKDTLLIATDTGPDSMTTSGYPRRVKIWKRGTSAAEAKQVFEGRVEDVATWPTVSHRPEGTVMLANRRPTFFTEELHLIARDGGTTKLALPPEIESQGIFGDHLLIQLRADWAIGGRTHPKGALVAVSLKELATGRAPAAATALITPSETTAISGISVAKGGVYVTVLDNVVGKLLALKPARDGWSTSEVPLPANGTVQVVSTDAFSDDVLVNFASFLQPDTLYVMAGGGKPEAIKALPARFDAGPFVSEQRFATSRDGTKVPYFIVRAKETKLTGDNPTLLWGYGGFELAFPPAYLSPLPISWIKAGGVYVVANIRGGGEFGPRWHQAALKENRQRAFDDFIAVGEHLVETKVTRPGRLGIQGGSNGGLLTGVAMTQRPDLFGASIIAVPLLDMLRYHTLLAGASWMDEYGNPEKPEDYAYISKYSPYQALRKDAKYPEAFVFTSTKDDRVHPGHARKFVARMQEMGHPVLYYENIEGGHSAASNLKQRAELIGLQVVYLMQQLMDKPGRPSN